MFVILDISYCVFIKPIKNNFEHKVFLQEKIASSHLSLISQLNTPGFSRLYPSILASISGVASLGLLPPNTPGLMLPVSWYLGITAH